MTGNSLDDNAQETYLSKEAMLNILQEARVYCRNNELELSFTSPGWIREYDLVQMNLNVPSCGAALSNMAIAPDGTVVPCQSWLNGTNLGNMLTDDWKHIWNNKQTKKIRKYTSKIQQVCPLAQGGIK